MSVKLPISVSLGLVAGWLLAAPAAGDIVTGGLIQDLDADVGVTESGGAVTSWQNQAASGGDDVATNRGAPTLIAGPNGHSAVRFDQPGGIKDRMAGTDADAFDALLDGGGHTWFAVVRPTQGANDSSKNAIFGTLSNQSNFSGLAAHVSNTVPAYMLRFESGGDQFTNGNSSIDDGSWHIVAGRLSAGIGIQTAEVFTDGPSAESTNSVNITGATPVDSLAVGSERAFGGENFVGDIARVLIYDRSLNETDLNATGATLGFLYDIEDHGFAAGPVPEIASFTATPGIVATGSPITLAWSVTDPLGGELQVAISPDVGDVSAQANIQITPGETTTYTLVAENINGSSTKQVTVTVGDAPTILAFSATDAEIRAGEPTTLSWNVTGAESVSVAPVVGAVDPVANAVVSPTTTTTYTLAASNAFAPAEAQVTVVVDETPIINSFTIDQPNIEEGTTITLSWDVVDADELSIEPDIGDVRGQASVQDVPASTQIYTLAATNSEGTSTATVSVIVGETVTISEFLAVNGGSRLDEDGDSSDWIDIHNTTGSAINLGGWFLTDDAALLDKWQFPSVTLGAGGYLVVYASGKDRAVVGSELHANFRLDGGGEYLALVKPDGVSITRHFAPQFPNQEADISYGIYGAQLEEGYFDPPTPGAPNGTGFDGFVNDTQFTQKRGFYDTPIQVGISSATPGALIRYKLDGSVPTESSGTLYSAPINISTTTTLRAIAYKPGFRPTNVDTQTYLFPSDIKSQADMDSDIVNAAPYSATIEGDLKSLPAMSLVLPNDSMFGGSGIYSNSGGRGMSWERAVSVEFFSADGSEEFQVDAGIRIHGADARGHQKKPFKLYFRSIYGPGRLRYPLFPGEVEEFDKLVLRGGGHEGWTSPYGSGTGAQSYSNTLLRDQFLRQTHGEMGNLSPRGRHAHLYINGKYWGVYIIHERTDEEFGASHLGGVEDDYDVIKTGGAVVDGTKADWSAMMNLANGGLGDDAEYAQMLGFLDVNSLIDNMIVRIWSGDIDWLRSQNTIGETGDRNKNWYALRNTRGAQPGGWQFFVWDGELSMGKGHRSNRQTNFNLSDVDINDSPGRLYTRLRDNAEFRLLFADRLQKHFFNGGAMTPENNQTRWLALADEIRDAMVAESARWGDAVRHPPYTRNGEWQNEIDWMADAFMAGRTTTVLNQFRAIGLYPSVDSPEFRVGGARQHGGITGDAPISFTPPPSGAIYYTTDASDPRISASVSEDIVLLDEFAPNARALVPSIANGGSTLTLAQWTDVAAPPNFATWKSGSTGVGFENNPDIYDPLINIYVPEMVTVNATAYVRVQFTIADQAKLDSIGTLILNMKYDDGFVAYINGTRVAAQNAPAALDWRSEATGSHPDSQALNFEPFDISGHKGALRIGANILAIHALNDTPGSSDMLVLPQLTYTTVTSTGVSPTAQLYSGAFTLPSSGIVRARVLNGGEWSALNEASFIVGTTPHASDLAVSEIHYRPLPPTSAAELAAGDERKHFEFIELMNISGETIDLSGVSFSAGLEFAFPIGTSLAPAARTVIASRASAYQARYGSPPDGEYSGNLNNDGDTITIIAADGTTEIRNFTYNDKFPWPESADGDGFSLVLIAPRTNPDHGDPSSWRPSLSIGGNPDASDASAFVGDPLADSDGDSMSDLLEHALAGTATSSPFPKAASRSIGVGGILGDYLVITFQRNLAADDVLMEVENSGDLSSWSSDAVFVSRINHGDGIATETWRAPLPIAPQMVDFLRLRVTLRDGGQ